MHLWEVKHDYHCNLGNYFDNDCGSEYKSFDGFLKAWGDSDMDMNLLFRWDWNMDEEANNQNDPYYRNGQLEIFWMGQRKGLYQYSIIEVCQADEDKVKAFLLPRWKHLSKLWQPISEKQPTDK